MQKTNALSPYQVELPKKHITHYLKLLIHQQIDEYIKSHQSNPREDKSPKFIANLNGKEQYMLHQ